MRAAQPSAGRHGSGGSPAACRPAGGRCGAPHRPRRCSCRRRGGCSGCGSGPAPAHCRRHPACGCSAPCAAEQRAAAPWPAAGRGWAGSVAPVWAGPAGRPPPWRGPPPRPVPARLRKAGAGCPASGCGGCGGRPARQSAAGRADAPAHTAADPARCGGCRLPRCSAFEVRSWSFLPRGPRGAVPCKQAGVTVGRAHRAVRTDPHRRPPTGHPAVRPFLSQNRWYA